MPARWYWAIWAVALTLVLAAAGWFVLPPHLAYFRYQPQEGDIVFQSLPHGRLVDAIEGATHSPYSHCGIVGYEDGGWVVYEAYSKVERTPLYTWFTRGRNCGFAVYRFKPAYQSRLAAIMDNVRGFLGRPYDIHYEMDDQKLYCSELIYKAFLAATGERLGKVVRLGDLDWKPFRQLIEQIEGGPVPLDRTMITPKDLAEAEQLEAVTSYGL
jgi:hypothetical protein